METRVKVLETAYTISGKMRALLQCKGQIPVTGNLICTAENQSWRIEQEMVIDAKLAATLQKHQLEAVYFYAIAPVTGQGLPQVNSLLSIIS